MKAYVVCKSRSVVTSTGELKWEGIVGPGGYTAKTWKTEAGAKRYADRIGGRVEGIFVHPKRGRK